MHSKEKPDGFIRYNTIGQEQTSEQQGQQQVPPSISSTPSINDYNVQESGSQQIYYAQQHQQQQAMSGQYLPGATNIAYGAYETQIPQQLHSGQLSNEYLIYQQQQHHQQQQQQQQRQFLPSLIPSEQNKSMINQRNISPATGAYQHRIPIQLPYVPEQRSAIPSQYGGVKMIQTQQYVNAPQQREDYRYAEEQQGTAKRPMPTVDQSALPLQKSSRLSQGSLSGSMAGSSGDYLRRLYDGTPIPSVSTPISSIGTPPVLSKIPSQHILNANELARTKTIAQLKSQEEIKLKKKRGRKSLESKYNKPQNASVTIVANNSQDSDNGGPSYQTPEAIAKKIAEDNIHKSVEEYAAEVREAELEVLGLNKNSKVEKQHAEQNRERSKHVYASLWLMKNCVVQNGGYVRRGRIFAQYVSSCAQNGLKPLSQASLGKLIRALFPNLTTRRLGMRGQSKYHYCGLKLVTDNIEQLHPSASVNQVIASPNSASNNTPLSVPNIDISGSSMRRPSLFRGHQHLSEPSIHHPLNRDKSNESPSPTSTSLPAPTTLRQSQNQLQTQGQSHSMAPQPSLHGRNSAPTLSLGTRSTGPSPVGSFSSNTETPTTAYISRSEEITQTSSATTYVDNGNIFFRSPSVHRSLYSDDVASGQQEKFDQQRDLRKHGMFRYNWFKHQLQVGDLIRDWLSGGNGVNDGNHDEGEGASHDATSSSGPGADAVIVAVGAVKLPGIPKEVVPHGTDSDITAALQSLYHIHCNTLYENVRYLNQERLANNLFLSSSGAISPQMYNLLISEELQDWVVECDLLTYVSVLNYVVRSLVEFRKIDDNTERGWEDFANTFYDTLSKSVVDLPAALMTKKLDVANVFLRLFKQLLRLLRLLRVMQTNYFDNDVQLPKLSQTWLEKMLPVLNKTLEMMMPDENYDIASNLLEFLQGRMLRLLNNGLPQTEYDLQHFFKDLCSLMLSMADLPIFKVSIGISQVVDSTVCNMVLEDAEHIAPWLLFGTVMSQFTSYCFDISKYIT
ncbi:RFX family transcription factor RNJ42_01614 [Nakaseomyces bracarensis]|uniref:RFX family transcription factor n=1 Tax=Nakaseomyces bracarensis TaxID=273131 RepID=UPI0038721C4D